MAEKRKLPEEFEVTAFVSKKCAVTVPEETEEQLHLALMQGIATKDVDKVREALHKGANVYRLDAKGRSPLYDAVASTLEITCLLLESGAQWNIIDSDGLTVGELADQLGHKDIYTELVNHACRVEFLLASLSKIGHSDHNQIQNNETQNETQNEPQAGPKEIPNSEYLQQKLTYSDGKLLDEEGNAVMMGWERPLMKKHAEIICKHGGDILNIGFGLGIIDEEIQKHRPRSHTIVEAHPDVYNYMLSQGWDKKEGVKVIFGRWQDVLDQLTQYDGIFFDTFGEYYSDLKTFQEAVVYLLKPTGIYSFFNGLSATNSFFHDVYCNIVLMELEEINLKTEWTKIPIDPSDPQLWDGVKRKYWNLKTYNLPTCTFATKE